MVALGGTGLLSMSPASNKRQRSCAGAMLLPPKNPATGEFSSRLLICLGWRYPLKRRFRVESGAPRKSTPLGPTLLLLEYMSGKTQNIVLVHFFTSVKHG